MVKTFLQYKQLKSPDYPSWLNPGCVTNRMQARHCKNRAYIMQQVHRVICPVSRAASRTACCGWEIPYRSAAAIIKPCGKHYAFKATSKFAAHLRIISFVNRRMKKANRSGLKWIKRKCLSRAFHSSAWKTEM